VAGQRYRQAGREIDSGQRTAGETDEAEHSDDETLPVPGNSEGRRECEQHQIEEVAGHGLTVSFDLARTERHEPIPARAPPCPAGPSGHSRGHAGAQFTGPGLSIPVKRMPGGKSATSS
jgi:hypothetical protein